MRLCGCADKGAHRKTCQREVSVEEKERLAKKAAAARAVWAKNPEKAQEKRMADYYRNRDMYMAGAKRWKEEHPDYWKKESYRTPRVKQHLKDRYEISLEQYADLVAKSEGKCAACGRKPTGENKMLGGPALDLDHCHKTGKIRGLLCWRCNRTLGILQDDTSAIQGLIKYIQTHSQES